MNVRIPTPCNEDWNKMKIGLISRHCESCDKAVMDFTKMNRVEIITYLLENSDRKICGRMNYKQFDFQQDDLPLIVDTLSKKVGNSSFLVLSLLCLSLAACSETPRKKSVNDKPKVEISGERTMGEVGLTPTKKKSTDDEASSKPVKKVMVPKVIPPIDPYPGIHPEPYYLGEPVIEPPQPLEEKKQDEILSYAEKMPEYEGGITALFDFIQKNLNYPSFELENEIQGTVYARFVVNTEGKIESPTILKSVAGSKNFDKEVIRVINKMPHWIPGENNGKKVKVYYTIPVKFKFE